MPELIKANHSIAKKHHYLVGVSRSTISSGRFLLLPMRSPVAMACLFLW